MKKIAISIIFLFLAIGLFGQPKNGNDWLELTPELKYAFICGLITGWQSETATIVLGLPIETKYKKIIIETFWLEVAIGEAVDRIDKFYAVANKENLKITIYNVLLYVYDKIPLEVYSLLIKKKELRDRIEKRVKKMFEDGFVEEVETLLEKGYNPSLYSFTSIGYEQVSKYILNKNACNPEDVSEAVKKETKRYADKQITFIKGLPKVKIFKNKEKLKADIIEKIQKKEN